MMRYARSEALPATGAASLGNKYYYLANGSYTTGLYVRDDNYSFSKVTLPVEKKLLVTWICPLI